MGLQAKPEDGLALRDAMGLFQGALTFLLEPLAVNSVKFTLREEFSSLNPVFAAFTAALKERAEQKT
jgi:hypothetical protein